MNFYLPKIFLALLFPVLLLSCRPLSNRKSIQDLVKYEMSWDGYNREFYIHMPPSSKRDHPLPVLFHLHGGGGTATGSVLLTFTRFNDLADRDGFIMVYPQAVDKNWNDGRKDGRVKAWVENIDDVGFITEIIKVLDEEYKIDKSRIFTTGMSNGGFMSTRLICDRADLFKGAAILTATLSKDYLPHCDPSRPTAVLVMNGTADPIVPYDGGDIKVLNRSRGAVISTDKFVDFWRNQNDCQGDARTTALSDNVEDGTTVFIEEYNDCSKNSRVVLYRIEGGGHTWPGGSQYLGERLIGKTSREINACDIIWEFFKSLN